MARHRNYRNYAYEDDMSDDVYGHSVEDYDMAVSPTTAERFMFRRSNSRDPNLSAYIADRFGRVDEEDEEEEDEDEPLNSSQDYRRPQLDPISEAKLSSCLDQLHSILGENLHEPTAVSAVIQCNYDVERALDQIFSQGEKQDSKKANSDPFGTEGFVSCKTQLFANIEQSEIVQYENNMKVNSASKDGENIKVTAGQPSKSLIGHPSGNASEKSSVNTFAQGDSFPQSGGPVLEKSVASHPLDLLQVSTHITQTFSSLYTTSQATESSSGQSVQSQPLDLLQSSAHNTLMSAPLSSLSQLGHLMSSQSAMSQTHEPLSAPLSSFSQLHQSSVSQPLDLLPASPQNTLLSAPLSSLTQLGGSSCAQARKTGFLDLLQASSQNTLLSTPLSSLSGGSLSCQSVTSQSLDPLEASPQKSLMSAPLSSFSQSGESLSGHPRTSQSLGFSQSSSQRTKLSASSSSMVPSGGSLFSELQPMDLLQMSPQNTLLSTSLSSLTKSEGTLSDSPVTSPSLDVLQPFHNPLLSVSLSSLSAHPTTRPQESSISLPLGSLSQLSFQQGNSVTGIPHSTSKSPLLQTMSSHTLLSTPLSRLSQTPFATAIYEPRQEPSLSTPLSSLSQTGHSVQSSLPLTSSGQLGNTEPLPMEQVVDDTEDVKYLAENLKNVHIPGSSSTLSAGKEDYDQNIQHKHKHSTSGTASTVELSVEQKEMKSEHFSVKKKVSASKQKRQVSSRWSDTHGLTAKPSLFGLALCYSLSVENDSTKVVVQRVVNELHNSDCLRITAFDFSTPSPDDIVKDKQKGAFSRKK